MSGNTLNKTFGKLEKSNNYEFSVGSTFQRSEKTLHESVLYIDYHNVDNSSADEKPISCIPCYLHVDILN